MDKVAHPDPVTVTVSAGGDHREILVSQFYSLGRGQSPPVEAMETVGPEMLRDFPGAADSRNQNHFLRFQPQVGTSLLQGGQNSVIAAAGTPGRPIIRTEILDGCHQVVTPSS